MVMGDIVLLQDEVNPARSAALDSGLEVTALHNHFFFDSPKVYFMHIGGCQPVLKAMRKESINVVAVGRAYQPRPPTIFQRSVSMGSLMVRRLAGRRVLPMR